MLNLYVQISSLSPACDRRDHKKIALDKHKKSALLVLKGGRKPKATSNWRDYKRRTKGEQALGCPSSVKVETRPPTRGSLWWAWRTHPDFLYRLYLFKPFCVMRPRRVFLALYGCTFSLQQLPPRSYTITCISNLHQHIHLLRGVTCNFSALLACPPEQQPIWNSKKKGTLHAGKRVFFIEANCTIFRPVILNESWYEFSSMTVYRSGEICYSVG